MKTSQLLSSLIPNPQSLTPAITEVSGYLREMVSALDTHKGNKFI